MSRRKAPLKQPVLYKGPVKSRPVTNGSMQGKEEPQEPPSGTRQPPQKMTTAALPRTLLNQLIHAVKNAIKEPHPIGRVPQLANTEPKN